MSDTPQPPTPFAHRLTPEVRREWQQVLDANRRSEEQYTDLPTSDKHTLIELAMQDASEESTAGTFTVADVYRRLPHGYIGRFEITRHAQTMCTRGVLGIHPRAVRNGAHRYGFREQP